MAHRDAQVALTEARERILVRLAALELDTSDAARRERDELDAQLEELVRSLELHTHTRRLPVLAAAPLVRCDAAWEGMDGDARTRRCGTCQREVLDLRAMTPDEIERFLAAGASSALRLHRRPDGRHQRGPCPRAQERSRRRIAAVTVAVIVGLLWLALPTEAAPMPIASHTPPADPFDAAAFVAPPAPMPMDIAASLPRDDVRSFIPGHGWRVDNQLDFWLAGEDDTTRYVVGRAIAARRDEIWACISDRRMHHLRWTDATELDIAVHPDGEVRVSRVRGRALARCLERALHGLTLARLPDVPRTLRLSTHYGVERRTRPSEWGDRVYSTEGIPWPHPRGWRSLDDER
jgi:hypothetical protein